MRGTSSRWLVGAAFFSPVGVLGFFSSVLQFASVFVIAVVLYWGASPRGCMELVSGGLGHPFSIAELSLDR